MYEPRLYRHWIKNQDLVNFNVTVDETDLHIRACTNLRRKALKLVLKYRNALKNYIELNPSFLTSLEPIPVARDAPSIVQNMADSSREVNVGPMASVAGAIAEYVGNDLVNFSPEIIIENGGDIYLKSTKKRLIGIYAGKSQLSGKIGIEIDAKDTPLGICTSSGTVGHSFSYGKADAVVTLADSTTFADAAATAIGNLMKRDEDISTGIEFAQGLGKLRGVVIIIGENIGFWGSIKLCRLST